MKNKIKQKAYRTIFFMEFYPEAFAEQMEAEHKTLEEVVIKMLLDSYAKLLGDGAIMGHKIGQDPDREPADPKLFYCKGQYIFKSINFTQEQLLAHKEAGIGRDFYEKVIQK